jgi:arylsulfatase A-like enzyme
MSSGLSAPSKALRNMGKHVFYEPALRVPLIFRWPGHVASGAVVKDFTESIDVAAAARAYGADSFHVAHGQSLIRI